MKTPRALRVVLTFVFGIFLADSGFGSSIPFSISIPARTAAFYPTGEVKITLQLSGNPGNSSLVVSWPVTFPAASPQTVTLPNAVVFGAPPADKVVFLQQGTNNLVIEYFPLSQFLTPGADYCSLVASPKFPYDVSFTLTTANNVTVQGAAIDSYSLPGYPSPPQLQAQTCSLTPFRRESTSPASLTITSPTQTTRGPLDIILVLDESGSMASTPAYDDWASGHQYLAGDAIQPTIGNAGHFVFLCIQGGTSGGPEPNWPQAASQVMDGSVLWKWTGDTNTMPRWNILQQAVSTFVSAWEQEVPSVASAPLLANDNLGVLFYNTVLDSAASIFFNRASAAPGCGHNWQNVINQVDGPNNCTTQVGHQPGGWTAMGKGLKAGICKYEYDANGAPLQPGAYCFGYPDAPDDGPPSAANQHTNDATIVLMTDGLQNQNPCIVPDGVMGCGSTATSGVNWKFDGDTSPVWQQHIPVATVGLGVESGSVPFAVLDGIANETGGTMEQTATASTAVSTFGNTLLSVLKGGSLSLLARTTGIADSSISAPTQFVVDPSVQRVVFVLSWQGGALPLDLQIIPPGGCSSAAGCTSPVSRSDGLGWTTQAIDIPGSGPTGQWAVSVVQLQFQEPRKLAAATGASPLSSYQLSVYAVETKLEYKFSVPQTPLGTGGTMAIAAEVSYNGGPLTNLGNAITVHVARPGTAVGTFLHNNDVPDSALQGGIVSGESITPYESKFEYLEGHSNILSSIAPQPIPTTYTLLDNGNPANGDASANDGIYSAIVGDLSLPGEYVFTITMDWTTPATGHVHRTETIKRQIQVTPDPNSSVVQVASGTTAGQFIVTVDPVDKFGNYLGPGYASAFQVQVSGGGSAVLPPADARQTGAYGITIAGVPAGADPIVTIKVGGTVIRSDHLSKLESNPKFGVFVDVGGAFPNGTFSNAVNAGFSLNGGLEYIFNPHVSAEGILGYHHFPGKIGGDVNVFQFSGDIKVYLTNNWPVRPFVNSGIGGYHFNNIGTNFGGNVGVGVLKQFPNSHWRIQGSYNFHAVNTPGTASKFSTVQVGIRYLF